MNNQCLKTTTILLDGKKHGLIKIEVDWIKKKVWIFSDNGTVIRSIEN